MQKVYIEHSGTQKTLDLAHKVRQKIDLNTDWDFELMVGEPMTPIDGVTLYTLNEDTKELEKLLSLTSVPGPAELRMILNWA